ncbi:MAG: MerR family transcriptional regulator [Oscillospiraceae bacterium]|nr:MerR family transcriptional regulator [Oscillospiraceae bacterium]
MYSIQEVSKITGLSAHTLRFYEKEGLLGSVERGPSGFRQYTDGDLEVLSGIRCLKNTGMSLQEIARFLALSREGDATLGRRVALLQAHREEVLARIAEMQIHLDKVTQKLDDYSKKLRAYEASEKTLSTPEPVAMDPAEEIPCP